MPAAMAMTFLMRSAQLDADDVVVGIEAEGVAGEFALDASGEIGVGRGDGDGGGGSGGDFLSEGRAAEDAAGEMQAAGGKHFCDDLGHAQAGFVLDALGGADEELARGAE